MAALSGIGNIISSLFGILFMAVGLVNIFWGNDPFFGVFILALALLYFPPVTAWLKSRTGFSIPGWVRVPMAFFILWAAMGVGELPGKIDLMLADLKP